MKSWLILLCLLPLSGCLTEKPQERQVVAPPAMAIVPEEAPVDHVAKRAEKPKPPFDYYVNVNDRLTTIEGQIGWMKERFPK